MFICRGSSTLQEEITQKNLSSCVKLLLTFCWSSVYINNIWNNPGYCLGFMKWLDGRRDSCCVAIVLSCYYKHVFRRFSFSSWLLECLSEYLHAICPWLCFSNFDNAVEIPWQRRGRSFLCVLVFCFKLKLLGCLYIQLLRESFLPFVPGSLSKQGMSLNFKYSIQCKFRNKPHTSEGGYM